MKPAVVLLPVLCCACGGGGAPAAPAGGGALGTSAQQVLESCVSTDLAGFAEVLGVVANLFESEEGAPLPEFDIVAGLLSGGVVPWTYDVDADGVTDLEGTVFFRDAGGNLTIPIDLGTILAEGIPDNPLDLIADIAPGTELHVTYEFDGFLTEAENAASGSGELVLEFQEGVVSTASGSAVLLSGECAFDVGFLDVGIEDFGAGGFPTASAEFDLQAGTSRLKGTIEFDGTNIAEFRASLDGGPEETILFDLEAGAPIP